MQVQSKVIIRESFSFHIPPQQIHHFSPLLLYDISVHHLFFRTAYHKPIGKSTFLPTSPVKSAPCSIATFLCLFPLFIGPYCRLRLLAACLAAALVALAVWLWPAAETEPQRPNSAADPAAATDPAPDPYLAACQTYYTAGDGREYHVFTAMTPNLYDPTTPVGYCCRLIPDGSGNDFPATVMVQDATTQEDCPEDFAPLLDSWDVTVSAPEGVGRVSLREAELETADTPALLYRRLWGDNTCTHNEIVWTLRMKNGDVLTLTQTIELLPQEVRTYSTADTPLETAQELQALLDRLAEEYDADMSITVELPDVTYDAPVSVGCAVTLKGSGTAFAAPVTVMSLSDTERCHAYVRFSEVSFEGDGSGTGVTARAPTYLENCRVTGWAVGGEAVTGGWVYLHGGYIGGNGVGARYDSAYSNSYTYTIRRIDFLNNTTALELLCLPPNSYAALDDCRFRGNGTDVYNPGGYRIEVNNGTEVTL